MTVTFNSGSAPTNVTSDNFKITGPYGAVAGQVTWDANSRTATWVTQPISSRYSEGPDLDMASNYTATVSGFNGGPYSFTFQTGPCGNVYAANTQIVDLEDAATHVYGINDSGAISGDTTSKAGTMYGFVRINGSVTKLKGTAYKVNGNNAAVGMYPTAGDPAAGGGWERGFLYQDGAYTEIRPPSSTGPHDQIWAYSINNLGVIVGQYNLTDAATGQYTYSSGFMRQPDGTYSDIGKVPEDINTQGHIVYWQGNTSSLYNGTYNNIAVPGCSTIYGYGLNDSDDIAGYAGGCDTSIWQQGRGGFVTRSGKTWQVVVPGCRFVTPYDINNQGQVVGVCTNEFGDHGFVATPK